MQFFTNPLVSLYLRLDYLPASIFPDSYNLAVFESKRRQGKTGPLLGKRALS